MIEYLIIYLFLELIYSGHFYLFFYEGTLKITMNKKSGL